MKAALTLTTLLMLGCFIPAGARAEDRSQEDEARVTLRQTAGCWINNSLFSRRAKSIQALIDHSPTDTTASWADSDTWLSLSFCLSRRSTKGETHVASLKFSPMLFRGAAFRALYLRQFGSKQVPAMATMQDDPPWRIKDNDAFRPLQRFGECIVSADPLSAHKLLAVRVGSAEERDIFVALAPVMSRCVAGGSMVRFSKTTIEGLVAEGLYHLAGGDIHLRKVSN